MIKTHKINGYKPEIVFGILCSIKGQIQQRDIMYGYFTLNDGKQFGICVKI